MNNIRIGIGYDAHAFREGGKLVLGGVEIDFPGSLEGHSDADVLTHAIIDAILGAASLGDIGRNFPDSDLKYKNIRSILLLEETFKRCNSKGIEIINIDSVVICEKPKISPYIDEMKMHLSSALGGLSVSRIGVKGKTTEKLGFTGRSEGIAAHAVALVLLSDAG